MKLNFSIYEIIYLLVVRIPMTIYGKIRGNLIYTHWGRGLNNFGDCLSPAILMHYGLTPVYTSKLKSDIILAGSILQWMPKTFAGYIVGTGGDEVPYDFPMAKILAVRGELTLNNLIMKNKNEIILGDPGLLMPYVYPEKVSVKYDLGIIFHFVDKDQDFLKIWMDKFTNNVIFISPLANPKSVIDKIKKCKYIISSSLHGLIIADAFNIPNMRFVNRQTMPTSFYDYKFDDYYSALEIENKYIEVNGSESLDFLIQSTNIKPQEKIEALKKGLNNTMITLSATFKNKK